MRTALVFMKRMEKKNTARFLLGFMAVILIFLALPGQPVEAVGNTFLGYSQLDTDAQREAYGLLNTHVGQVAETFSVAPELGVSMEDMKTASEALIQDHPEYFYFLDRYMNFLKMADGTLAVNLRYVLNKTVTPALSYDAFATAIGQSYAQIQEIHIVSVSDDIKGEISLEEIHGARDAYEAKVAQIIASIPSDAKTIPEKEKYIHDYLVKHISYGISAYDQLAYGAIVDGRAVCAGYARAFQDLMTRLGVQCWYLTGFAGEPHAWNVLWIDGKCVYTDVTWADQSWGILYGYYNISKDRMNMDHQVDAQFQEHLGACDHTGCGVVLTPETAGDSVITSVDYAVPSAGYTVTMHFGDNNEKLRFYNSDPGVATVNDQGIITTLAEGKTTVTVIFEEKGYAQVYNITVGDPADDEPEESKPEETKPEATEPEESKPVEIKPEATEPEETKPAETKPEATEPEESKPVETKPEATEPEESKPIETKPEATEPEESKPVETKPEATEPEVTEPSTTAPDPTEATSENTQPAETLGTIQTDSVSTDAATGGEEDTKTPGKDDPTKTIFASVIVGCGLVFAVEAVCMIRVKKK